MSGLLQGHGDTEHDPLFTETQPSLTPRTSICESGAPSRAAGEGWEPPEQLEPAVCVTRSGLQGAGQQEGGTQGAPFLAQPKPREHAAHTVTPQKTGRAETRTGGSLQHGPEGWEAPWRRRLPGVMGHPAGTGQLPGPVLEPPSARGRGLGSQDPDVWPAGGVHVDPGVSLTGDEMFADLASQPRAGHVPFQTTERSLLREGPGSTQLWLASPTGRGRGSCPFGCFQEDGRTAGGRHQCQCQCRMEQWGRRAELHGGGRGQPASGPPPAAGRKPTTLTFRALGHRNPDPGGGF